MKRMKNYSNLSLFVINMSNVINEATVLIHSSASNMFVKPYMYKEPERINDANTL